jgi:Na+-translocating ferredoxin:NAD+ oxidoreductase RnfD subunit
MAAERKPDVRLAALRRFAVAITALNVLGHTWFGFEQSIAQPLVALLTAYCLELGLEALDARLRHRRPRFAGGFVPFVDSLLSAHITGLAVSMLLYANERLMPVVFAAAVAIASKHIFRAPVAGGRTMHVFNPSNIGITATLLCFPWVGIAAPYMFTENLGPVGDWVLPALIVTSGSLLNTLLTRKLPLILTWLGCFALQATLRSLVFGTPLAAGFIPMTGVAFILFTFYMVTDPATTPSSRRGQMAFGAAMALAYGSLIASHIVFDLFFGLSVVCAARGLGLWGLAPLGRRTPAIHAVPVPVLVSTPTPAPAAAAAVVAVGERVGA